MKRKHQRLLFIGIAFAFGVAAVLLSLSALRDNIVYFYTPSELEKVKRGEYLRLGGLVEKGSLKSEGETVRFIVTDDIARTEVDYRGLLPGLFREGQGVVAEGTLSPQGMLMATRIMAKHDEYYMPPEVAKALKASGHWKTDYERKGEATPAPALPLALTPDPSLPVGAR